MTTDGITLHYHKSTKLFCISGIVSCECGNHTQRDIEYGTSNFEDFKKEVAERMPDILNRLKRMKK